MAQTGQVKLEVGYKGDVYQLYIVPTNETYKQVRKKRPRKGINIVTAICPDCGRMMANNVCMYFCTENKGKKSAE